MSRTKIKKDEERKKKSHSQTHSLSETVKQIVDQLIKQIVPLSNKQSEETVKHSLPQSERQKNTQAYMY